MKSVKTISKVTPQNVLTPNTNNFVVNDLQIIYQIKKLILIEAFLGINRLFLFRVSYIKAIILKIFSLILLCFNVYLTISMVTRGTTHLLIKNLSIIEYVATVILVMTASKLKLTNFFKNLHDLDVMLNIQNCLSITTSSKKALVAVILCVFYNCYEHYLEIKVHYNSEINLGHLFMLIEYLTHDIEQIFFFTLLQFTYQRILIVKAQTVKLFNFDDKAVEKRNNEVEALSAKKNLEISSLHRIYELLHGCSSELNSVFSVSVSYNDLYVLHYL